MKYRDVFIPGGILVPVLIDRPPLWVEEAKGLIDRCLNKTTVDIRWGCVGIEGAKALAVHLENPLSKITELLMYGNHVGNEGVGAIAAALCADTDRVNKLQVLHLDGNYVGDEGAKALAVCIAKNPFGKMTELKLESNHIGDEGATALAAALQTNRTMTELYLRENNIGDEGAKALAAALEKSPTMTTITLNGNDISDEGIKALAESAARSMRLTTLCATSRPVRQKIVKDALARAVEYRKVLAFMSAVVPGHERSRAKTPAERFVMRDGDNAIGHRIAWFLVGS